MLWWPSSKDVSILSFLEITVNSSRAGFASAKERLGSQLPSRIDTDMEGQGETSSCGQVAVKPGPPQDES
jgi:hypothetical protein